MTIQRSPVTDALLKRALLDRAGRPVPDLLPAILATTQALPQRRVWFPDLPRPRRALVLGVSLALLIAALVGVGLLGTGVFRAPPTELSQPRNGPIVTRVGGDLVYAEPITGAVLSRLAVDSTLARATRDLSWSPDGTRLAIGTGEDIWIYTVAAQNVRLLAHLVHGSLEWSPDGTAIAVGRGQQISLVDPESGTQTVIASLDDIRVGGLTWSPDGSLLAFAGLTATGDHVFTIRRNGSGLTSLVGPAPIDAQWGILSPVWSPDGTTIAYFIHGDLGDDSFEDLDLMLKPAAGSAGARSIWRGGCGCAGYEPALEWAPDGGRLALLMPVDASSIGLSVVDPLGTPFEVINREARAALAWRPDRSR